MLYSEEIYQPPLVRPLFDRWVAWLKTKNPDEKYDWRFIGNCPCGQFYGSKDWVVKHEFRLLNRIARGFGNEADWTFGKCLERAKTYRANAA